MIDRSSMGSELKALEVSLTKQFHSEMAKIDEMRARREEKRRGDIIHQQKILESLLAKQQENMKESENRRRFWIRFILGPSGVFAAILAAVIGYTESRQPTEKDQMDKMEDVKRELNAQILEVESHLRRNDIKIQRTVDILLNQQVQKIDSHDHLAKMIERAHPQSRRVPEPASLAIGREQAKRIKKRFEGENYASENPLEGIE